MYYWITNDFLRFFSTLGNSLNGSDINMFLSKIEVNAKQKKRRKYMNKNKKKSIVGSSEFERTKS